MSNVFYRPRRLRVNQLVRDMAAETQLKMSGMIQPYFVCEGRDVKFEIPSMPGIFRESPDSLVKSIAADFKLGIKRVMLFGVPHTKDAAASSAMGENAVVNQAVRMLKDKFGEELFVSADVCLCAYTDSGHCGVLEGSVIDNDKTLPLLAEMAVDLARAGCDCVAPSDMMDGRVGAIRDSLEDQGFVNTLILAYSAKYASAYYGPFREAAESAPQKGDRQSYQMDVRNRLEAVKEVALDIEEGADMVMVKPALAYLDIISDVRAATELPVAAYNVSGEYSMVKLMVQAGYAEEKRLVLENLTAITRAGADIILTYHLRDILKNEWLNG
ncbi:MAG: porphobilinogen synthase [Candidatus Zixiibacteriota bacterium]|nr:MAG: porphobilinogen synthase [candidate division Zixibacteria bacterium]